jgi:hypothetical protein
MEVQYAAVKGNSKVDHVHKCHAMKMCKEMEVKLPSFLTLAVDGGQLSAVHCSCFTPVERIFIIQCIEG